MKKIITIDFDETLFHTNPQWNGVIWCSTGTMQPVHRVHQYVIERATNHTFYIVTFRNKETSGNEVEDLIAGANLPIKDIIYTGFKPKAPFVKSLGSILHIDDDEDTCHDILAERIDVLFVYHNQPLKYPKSKNLPQI